MNDSLRSSSAFSLIEVTLAIGIAAFCLIAVFGLIPVGVQTNRNANSQTAATNIIAAVVADMRATAKPYNNSKTYFAGQSVLQSGSCYAAITTTTGNPPPIGAYWGAGSTCNQFGIDFGTPKTIYFDSEGQFAISIGPASRYQVNVTFPWVTGNVYGANLRVTWPAAATPANASGSVEIFAAFDRN